MTQGMLVILGQKNIKKMFNSEIQELVNGWQAYLRLQKNYSKNTIESYLNDLKAYFIFIQKYTEESVSIKSISSVFTLDGVA